MDRGAWWATVPWVTKESDMTEQLTVSYTITVLLNHQKLFLTNVSANTFHQVARVPLKKVST